MNGKIKCKNSILEVQNKCTEKIRIHEKILTQKEIIILNMQRIAVPLKVTQSRDWEEIVQIWRESLMKFIYLFMFLKF